MSQRIIIRSSRLEETLNQTLLKYPFLTSEQESTKMALIFRKVAPYGSEGLEKGLNYYAGLAAQRISPPLLKETESYIKEHVKKRELRNVKLILSSPQKRAIQTAKIN